MATGRSTKLTGALGEFLVAAELCRLGLIATPFSGNVPHYDIVTSDDFGGHLVVQVKAINKKTWQFDVSKFVEISMNGHQQIIGKPCSEPFPNLFCVFVALGKSNREDRYFVFSWLELRTAIIDHHRAYLATHDGVRPKTPDSTHCSISISELEQYEDQWKKIQDAIVRTRIT